MRGQLLAITQPVRRTKSARAVAILGRVCGTLPATVLGDDLIRLMSGRLQRVLKPTHAVARDAHAPLRMADFHPTNAPHLAKEARSIAPALCARESWRLPWGSVEGPVRA